MPLVELAQQRGVHPDVILRGSKLFYSDLAKVGASISTQQYHQIVANLIIQPSCKEVGFVFGQYLLNTLVASYGELLFNCGSLRQLLKVLVLKGKALFPLMHFRTLKDKQSIHLVFSSAIEVPSEDVQRFNFEMLAALISGYVKWRCQTAAIRFQFPYPQPEYQIEYLSHIQQSFSFDHSDFTIALDYNELNQTQQGAFPYLINKQLRVLTPDHTGFLATVHRLLLKQPKSNIENIAESLAMSPATFKRKLKQHGTTFVQEKDKLLRQQAMFHVAEQGLSNEQAARALQFDDITNFRRAFKRWTGGVPSHFRKA
ncbi:helix-turn-helix domain-containing protein [Pseudoalteromonas sp. T1lg65]|uniref:AraC family transcriptional regulator n=1 Tax=Pseudoalteromonas sp. T1lg65 TaxID=2077101 RepID=UPI003F792CA6